MDDKELDNYCWAWNEWCRTRKYYLAPNSKNLLARMQPGKVSNGVDAALSEDMSFFNMAIHALADMSEPDAECFIAYYAHVLQNKLPIKAIAHKMGVGVRTFYEKKARFARKAFSLAQSLKKAHQQEQEAEACHDNLD